MAEETPLADLRVVERGSGLAASYASFLLAALGAEVVEVEPPGGAGRRLQGRDAGRARGRRGGLRAAPRRARTGGPGERAPRRLRAQQRHLRHGTRDPWLALAVRRSARPDADLLALPHRRRLALRRRPDAHLPREADDRARARRPARRPAPAGEPARLRRPRDQGLRAAGAGTDPRQAYHLRVAPRSRPRPPPTPAPA